MTEYQSPAAKALAEMGVPFQEFIHQGEVASIGQAAAERNQQTEQVIRSILFRITEGEYVMVLVAGPKQIYWKALRQYFRHSRLTMAEPEEVLEVTGYQIGAVSPFGLKTQLPIYVDFSVVDQEEISLGSGIRGTAVIMKMKDMMAALNQPKVHQFTQR